jgi:hypothetical protein
MNRISLSELVWTEWLTFSFHKMQRISWISTCKEGPQLDTLQLRKSTGMLVDVNYSKRASKSKYAYIK